jgi:hypothetical protein
MTEPANWRDVKAKARAADPTWDSAERVARRQQMREQMLAAVSGAQLAEIRQQLGLTQVQLAEATGLRVFAGTGRRPSHPLDARARAVRAGSGSPATISTDFAL